MHLPIRVATAAAVLALAAPASAQSLALTFLGEQTFAPGTQVLGTTLGGLSGIDYSASLDRYIAISDDPSNARFYTLDLALTPTSFTGVSFTQVTTFKTPSGGVYANGSIDPESIRFASDSTVVYTSEGFANNGVDPFIRTANLADGTLVGPNYTVPGYYLASGNTGIRNNLAFESLAIGNGVVAAATENALKQDGPQAGVTDRSPARIITFNPETGAPIDEFVYLTDSFAIPPQNGNFATSGLVELLHVQGTQYLALERSFTVGAPGTGYDVKIYGIDLATGTDVGGVLDLDSIAYTPVTKTLLFDVNSLGIPLDNIEGITFGETLSDGSRSLILVSDDNLPTGPSAQFTQFLAFRLGTAGAVPEPATWAMMIGGFGCVGGAVRRRRVSMRFA